MRIGTPEKKNKKLHAERTAKKTVICENRKCFLLLYTFLFVLLFGFIILMFLLQGRSFVYHADAWRQHVRALAYYGKWLRGIVYNIFVNHSLFVETWSFGLGYGGDILTTLQYYCIGEPLTALAMFVPEKYTKIFFEILMVVRPYLAGLSFYAYAEYVLYHRYRFIWMHNSDNIQTFGQRLKHILPILTGSLCYVFSGTVLYIGMLHPYFVTPMIWFPLLLLGIEKVLKERKPAFLMVVTFLSGLSNFYFFYILLLLAAGYALVRIMWTCVKWKERLKKISELIICVIGGLAGAGCILVPILIQYRNNPRGTTDYSVSLFYDADYYKELLSNLVSFINHPQYDTELCMSFVAVAAVVIMFFLKGHRQLKTAVILSILMLCFPAAGYVLNGFSYVINRWTFAVEFLISFILVIVWSDCLYGESEWLVKRKLILKQRNNKKGLNEASVRGKSAEKKDSLETKNLKEKESGTKTYALGNRISVAILLLAVCSIAFNLYTAYWLDGFTDEFVRIQTPEEYIEAMSANEVKAVAMAASGNDEEEVFYRYTGKDLTLNAALLEGISSTQFAWSLANGCVSDFFEAIGNLDEQNFAYYALDDRIILNALVGAGYYTLSEWDTSYENQHAMYGFIDGGFVSVVTDEEATDSSGEERDSWESAATAYHIYENAFALGFGYTYTSVISESEFYSMSMTQRQEALLQGVVLSDEAAGEAAEQGLIVNLAAELHFYEEEPDFTISCDEGVTLERKSESDLSDDNRMAFYVTKAGSSVTIEFEGLEDSETYLVLEGLSVQGLEGEETLEQYAITFKAYSGDYEMTDKTLNFKTASSQYYSGWKDFIINLGYSSLSKTSAVITFPAEGVYTVQDFRVVCQPMVEAMSQIALLQASTLANIDLGKNAISYATNMITGTIVAEQTRFLLLNIPYSSGWTCYVDGEKVSLERANVMFIGLTIAPGEHEIVLKYHTPGLLLGCIVSVFGLAWMGFII